MKALSENDDLYALPKSGKTTVEGITADIDPEIKVTKRSIPGEQRYDLTFPDGNVVRLMVRKPNPYGPTLYGFDQADGELTNQVDERPGDNPEEVAPDTEDVFIDASLLSSGGGGAKAYQIAATFAHNTDRIFIGDPAGLSDEALRRRPEQMLSSALKFGTTRHLAPHPRQVQGDKGLGIPPLKWVYDDDLGNIRRLIDLNLKALENTAPSAPNLKFDASTGQFTNDITGVSGSSATQELLHGLLDPGRGGAGAGVALAGRRTLARGAVLRSLLREAGRESAPGGRRDGLLAGLARLGDDSPQAVRGLFSRTGLSEALASGVNNVRDIKLPAGYVVGDFITATHRPARLATLPARPSNLSLPTLIEKPRMAEQRRPTMQELYRPKAYPAAIKAELDKAPPLMIEIANRWMLGWPKRVKALIETGEYLEALRSQEDSERTAISAPGTNHLARHEAAELYGLTMEPPYPTEPTTPDE